MNILAILNIQLRAIIAATAEMALFPKPSPTTMWAMWYINIPSDRLGKFEPQIIPKGETISTKIQDAILGMHSRGMTTSDVRNQVLEIYGLSISETTVSNITERVMECIQNHSWNRL
jgi:transposase-like protein